MKPKTLWAACWNPKPFGSFSTWDGCPSILLSLHFTFTVKLVFIVEAVPLLRFYSRQGKTEIREKKACVVFPGRLCLLWMLILRWDICTQWWAGETKRQQRGSMTPWVPPLQFIVQHCRLLLYVALRRSDSWSPEKHWRWGRVYLDFDSRRRTVDEKVGRPICNHAYSQVGTHRKSLNHWLIWEEEKTPCTLLVCTCLFVCLDITWETFFLRHILLINLSVCLSVWGHGFRCVNPWFKVTPLL